MHINTYLAVFGVMGIVFLIIIVPMHEIYATDDLPESIVAYKTLKAHNAYESEIEKFMKEGVEVGDITLVNTAKRQFLRDSLYAAYPGQALIMNDCGCQLYIPWSLNPSRKWVKAQYNDGTILWLQLDKVKATGNSEWRADLLF